MTTTDTTYTVSQQFESLGDPFPKTFPTLDEANAYAISLRKDLSAYIAGLNITRPASTGWADEVEAWETAVEMCDLTAEEEDELEERGTLNDTYLLDAADYVAEQAVVVEED